MSISNIELTDTFDQWRIKDNEMIDVVNSLSDAGSIVSINSPTSGQMLLYDGSVFRNVTLSGAVSSVSAAGVVTLISNSTTSKGRMRFAGCAKLLY